MTRKIVRLEDYISSKQAADILSKKLGRQIDPDYIRKLKNVRSHKASDRCYLYHKADIEAVTIKERQRRS